jgi:hypothetical protein
MRLPAAGRGSGRSAGRARPVDRRVCVCMCVRGGCLQLGEAVGVARGEGRDEVFAKAQAAHVAVVRQPQQTLEGLHLPGGGPPPAGRRGRGAGGGGGGPAGLARAGGGRDPVPALSLSRSAISCPSLTALLCSSLLSSPLLSSSLLLSLFCLRNTFSERQRGGGGGTLLPVLVGSG